MGVSSYIARRRVVEIGARRFVVRSPTVATAVVLVERLGPLLSQMRELDVAADVALPILFGRLPVAAAAVLETCVESAVPSADWPHAELGREIAGLCDLDSMLDGDEGGGTADPSKSFAEMARAFGCAPHELMEWPWDSFREAGEALSVGATQQAAGLSGDTADRLRAIGLGVYGSA